MKTILRRIPKEFDERVLMFKKPYLSYPQAVMKMLEEMDERSRREWKRKKTDSPVSELDFGMRL